MVEQKKENAVYHSKKVRVALATRRLTRKRDQEQNGQNKWWLRHTVEDVHTGIGHDEKEMARCIREGKGCKAWIRVDGLQIIRRAV